MDTTNPDEWSGLNTIRWELEDLDKDIYLGQFIKNNDALSKLIDKIKDANQDAAKLINTIQNVEDAVKDLRDKIDQASPLISEISGFLVEVEKTMVLIKDGA
jgi:predicted  nucleic acid-binding Zn-ribbon protein